MTKSNSPLVGLGRQWVPIFADPDRDYQYLSECRSFRRTGAGLRLNAVTSDGESVTVTLAFVTPEVLRVQAFLLEPPPRRTPMLIEKRRPPVPFKVTADKEAITLSSSALKATIRRQPWRMTVENASGKLVYQQQVQDRAIVFHMSLPPGFSRDAEGRTAFHECFSLTPDEHLFGLGEHYGPLDKRGQRHVAWSRDPYGVNTTDITYHNTPFFMSSRGYGIFINQASRSVYELGLPSAETGAFRVEDPYLDYFLIYGPGPKEILARYTDLTGRAPVPPLWSFGLWTSRCMYRDRPQVEEVVGRYRELGIPLGVVHLDPLWMKERKKHILDGCDFIWDHKAFPDPKGFIQWLGERGVKLSLWENPYIYVDTPTYRQALRRGYLVRMPDGSPATSMDNGGAVIVDFTNPRARRWWQRKHVPLLRMGVPTFKTDYGEAVPEEAVFSDGRSGLQMHNLYPLLYNQAVFEVIERERGEAIVFARSGYAGSQRYPINWMGDSQCTWNGMAGALRGGLSIGLSGIPFWSHDVGGFVNPDNLQPPHPTLYIRWAQWGLLSSHTRFHGLPAREPWYFGEKAIEVVREFARLRYRLLPYLYALSHEAHETGLPVVRPLWLEYPQDPHTPYVDQQYLLGPYLLVAPVFNEEGRCNIYLPPGRWYDWWDGTVVEGPRYLSASVPIERLPLYVRGDSLLPLAPAMDHIGQRDWEPIELHVRVEKEAQLRFFDPQHPVDVKAQRRGKEVEVSLSVKVPRKLEIRLIEPGPARSVTFEGKVEDATWENTPAGTVARLHALGRCSLRASF
jgi:alpha-D-xyloside xylohydrolase